jgi:hypothetical protein
MRLEREETDESSDTISSGCLLMSHRVPSLPCISEIQLLYINSLLSPRNPYLFDGFYGAFILRSWRIMRLYIW